MIKRDDDLFRGSEPLRADRAQSDSHDTEKKDGLLGGDADGGDDTGTTRRDQHGEGDSDAKDTDSDTNDSRSLDGKD